MAKNPYDRDNFPGKFDITYVGHADGFYCYRVHFLGHKGMDVCMYEMELSQWLFENCHGEAFADWFMGNGFGDDPAHPKVNLVNTFSKSDTFVLLRKEVDMVRFEKAFPTKGFTPGLLKP